MRVLIVEDDPELAGLLRDGLRAQRIDPTLAPTFAEGRDRARGGSFDVIILDVRLPGGTGFDLCGELRRGGRAYVHAYLARVDRRPRHVPASARRPRRSCVAPARRAPRAEADPDVSRRGLSLRAVSRH